MFLTLADLGIEQNSSSVTPPGSDWTQAEQQAAIDRLTAAKNAANEVAVPLYNLVGQLAAKQNKVEQLKFVLAKEKGISYTPKIAYTASSFPSFQSIANAANDKARQEAAPYSGASSFSSAPGMSDWGFRRKLEWERKRRLDTARYETVGMGDGATQWYYGQLTKIDIDVRSGRWTDMLIELIRLTPESMYKEPTEILRDPILTSVMQKFDEVYNPSDPTFKGIGKIALLSMGSKPFADWDGESQPPPPPVPPIPGSEDKKALAESAMVAQFEPAIWWRNFNDWAQYQATHRPGGDWIKRGFTDVMKASSYMDKTLPGWTILVDVAMSTNPLTIGLKQALTQLVGQVTGPIASQFAAPLVEAATSVPLTTLHVAGTAVTTQGPLTTKLLAASVDALAAAALVVQVAVIAVVALSPASMVALAALMAIVQGGLQMAMSALTAEQVKQAAREAQDKANFLLSILNQQEKDLQAQIDAIRKQRALVDSEVLSYAPAFIIGGVGLFGIAGMVLYLRNKNQPAVVEKTQ